MDRDMHPTIWLNAHIINDLFLNSPSAHIRQRIKLTNRLYITSILIQRYACNFEPRKAW
jgi:hypothetical protein